MQCQQCGRPLASANAICVTCDQELSHPSHLEAGTPNGQGRYGCPACHGSFDRWVTTPFPPNARWYTPQQDIPACPLCAAALQWKRDPEPAQLPAELQGIAMGMVWVLAYTTPTALLQWIKEHMGKGAVLLMPLLVFALFFIAVRPALLATGGGLGHFVMAQASPSERRKQWAIAMSSAATLVCYWTAPPAVWLPIWTAWVGLGAAGCLTAIAWRRSAKRRFCKPALDSATHTPSNLP